MTDVLMGVLPVVPTIFADDESLDLNGQERVTQFVADAGASAAVCILANYSEQFSLDDDERRRVLDTTMRRWAAAGHRGDEPFQRRYHRPPEL